MLGAPTRQQQQQQRRGRRGRGWVEGAEGGVRARRSRSVARAEAPALGGSLRGQRASAGARQGEAGPCWGRARARARPVRRRPTLDPRQTRRTHARRSWIAARAHRAIGCVCASLDVRCPLAQHLSQSCAARTLRARCLSPGVPMAPGAGVDSQQGVGGRRATAGPRPAARPRRWPV